MAQMDVSQNYNEQAIVTQWMNSAGVMECLVNVLAFSSLSNSLTWTLMFQAIVVDEVMVIWEPSVERMYD